jgi:uncharacterized protein (TIGR00255 family)
MLKSMTGFGRAKYEVNSREYIIDMKSVNNRYSDISIKMPRSISFLEEKVKQKITSVISRGKVEVFITFNNYSDKGKNIRINSELAKIYINEIQKLSEDTNNSQLINIQEILKLPDVLNIQLDQEAEELIWNELQIVLSEAIDNFINMRKKEGKKIQEDLENRILFIEQNVNNIDNISAGLVQEYIVKLEKRINEILKNNMVDESRLAQEVVIYSDKCSVEEELTRLKSHIIQFKDLLNSNNATGKKIDFLIQEMNRETNTIGSKANNLQITNYVIEIKTELENIREQIQNVE